MKTDMLTRLIRAIADGDAASLRKLANRVVEEERATGHHRVAERLDAILKKSGEAPASLRSIEHRELQQLPTSRRSGKELATVVPRESLEHHMVLPDDVEVRFRRIEKEFAARERLGAFGLRPRKTVLLYGHPGCGKSLGAKRLAWNTGLPLLKVRFDSLLSSYFGESASNLRSVFDAAKERPCVLLLDECDFIARSRTNSKDIGEASRIVNSLLQLMEDYDAPGLLVATTNLESALDEALFRRFDDVFQLPLPGLAEIESLLKLTLSAIDVSRTTDWGKVSASLHGWSSAMVVKAAQDAAKAAVLSNRKTVVDEDLMIAISELRRSGSAASES